MSPLACIQSLLYASATGELAALQGAGLTSKTLAAVVGNGGLAFVLNVVSFTTNKMVGALSMTVAGNVKQCLSVVVGVWVFRVKVGWLNGTGIVVALVGGAWYASIEAARKKRRAEELIPIRSEKEIV